MGLFPGNRNKKKKKMFVPGKSRNGVCGGLKERLCGVEAGKVGGAEL